MKKIRGEVTYILRDKATEEVISTCTKENIITDMMYRALAVTSVLNIGITSVNMYPTSTCYSEPTPSSSFTTEQIKDTPTSYIPTIGKWISINLGEFGVSDPYIEFNGRFNPFTSERVINSIYLKNEGSVTGDSFSQYYSSALVDSAHTVGLVSSSDKKTVPPIWNSTSKIIVAFLKLDSPLIQATNQIIDVYYRLYFPYDYNQDNLVGFTEHQQNIYEYGLPPAWDITRNFTTGSSPFKVVSKLKGSDIDRVSSISLATPVRGLAVGPIQYNPIHVYNPNYLTNTAKLDDRDMSFYSQNADFINTSFEQHTGKLISTIGTWYSYSSYVGSLTNVSGYGYSTRLENIININSTTNKIGNIFGLGDLTTNPLSPNFVNADNLSPNTGNVFIEGSWNNIGTPSSPGLYYPGSLPEMVFLKLTNPGNVGTSTYKILKQKYFGNLPQGFPKVSTSAAENNTYSNHLYGTQEIWSLSGRGSSRNGTSAVVYDQGILDEISDQYLTPRQISASCRFDDSSVVFVKSNKIILYNIAAGDYWKFEASYTAIHQVAVVSNKIYVACRATGLWVIDPYNSLDVISLNAPSPDINLTACHGVAEGYNNTVWAVGTNCLCSFDGSTWTKYDESTTPAISMPGITDNNWFNVEYLKVDKDSSTNEMLLVRKITATTNSSILGVWWSTAGITSNTGVEQKSTSLNAGYPFAPRIHRGHLEGLGGFWVVFTQYRPYKLTFGTTTITDLTEVPSSFSNITNSLYTALTPAPSVILFNHQPNSPALWLIDGTANTSVYYESSANYGNYGELGGSGSLGNQAQIQLYTQRLVGPNNTTIQSLNSSQSGFNYADRTRSYLYPAIIPQEGTYHGSYALNQHGFLLCPGVLVNIIFSGRENNSDTVPMEVVTRITNIGLDKTQQGGPMGYICRQEYGWNGTAWELNNSNSKTTHSVAEELFDGVTARFEDAQTGTSFVTPSHYQFVLFDGFIKDNATKAKFGHLLDSLYFPSTTKSTDLEFNTIPSSRTGATGTVGIDIYKSSFGASIDPTTGYVKLPGQNNGQYATGNLPLIGDFEISYNVTNLSTTLHPGMSFGIGRSINVSVREGRYSGYRIAKPQYGFCQNSSSNETNPIINRFNTFRYGEDYNSGLVTSNITSLTIKRLNGVITSQINNGNTNTYTTTNYASGSITESTYRGGEWRNVIRPAHKVLDLIWATGRTRRDPALYPLPESGFLGPSVQIISNGSAVYMCMGNPATFTGRFQQGFAGIDLRAGYEPVILIDGLPATILKNYLDPGPGEVYLDAYSGVLYFNEADIGKPITAEYSCIVV